MNGIIQSSSFSVASESKAQANFISKSFLHPKSHKIKSSLCCTTFLK
eukprot:01809.XXX_12786_12926_1 [CDS] Oithona nana genome sequencing.